MQDDPLVVSLQYGQDYEEVKEDVMHQNEDLVLRSIMEEIKSDELSKKKASQIISQDSNFIKANKQMGSISKSLNSKLESHLSYSLDRDLIEDSKDSYSSNWFHNPPDKCIIPDGVIK